MTLVHKNETPLFVISVIFGSLVWLAAIGATFGLILVYVLLGLLAYLFAQSGFIAHLRGNAVELGPDQFPDLYKLYRECCETLEMETVPRAYLLMSEGLLNALATRFLRRHYVVLYSSVVEALRSRPEALRFYFGHELGHIKRGHLNLRWLLFPALILPLLGAAYRRAQEYTCDLHGLATSKSPGDAMAALALLGTGGERLPQVNVRRFIAQQAETGGFWMSFHELTSDYPWLCKRLARVATANGTAPEGSISATPRRNFFAWLLALFVPRIGVPGSGGVVSLLMVVAVIGILAAIAIPAYQDYTARAQVAQVMPMLEQVEAAAAPYVEREQAYPSSPEDIGLPEFIEQGPVSDLAIGDEGIELTLRSANAALNGKTIILGAQSLPDGRIGWNCFGGTLEPKYRPANCRPGQ